MSNKEKARVAQAVERLLKDAVVQRDLAHMLDYVDGIRQVGKITHCEINGVMVGPRIENTPEEL